MAKLPTVADLPLAERQALAALAAEEIRNPCGGFDTVPRDGGHPLQAVVAAGRYASPAFNRELAARVVRELRNPSGKFGGSAATRRQLAQDVGLAQDEIAMPNFGRPMQRYGRDQEEMPPRGGRNFPNDPNGEGMIDAEEAQARLQQIFDALDPSERENMIASLAAFLDQNGNNPDVDVDVDQEAMDRGMRAGRRGSARDTGIRANNKQALDAAIRTQRRNSAGFDARWGNLTRNIEVWG